MAVEVVSSPDRQIIKNETPLPVFVCFYKPRDNTGEVLSVESVEAIPSTAFVAFNFYCLYAGSPAASGMNAYIQYDPIDDIVYVPGPAVNTNIVRRIINGFVESWAYKQYVHEEDSIDFLNVEGLTGTISQSVGKMIAVGLLLGIGLLSFKVGISSLDKFLDNKFWYKRFQNERSALEKEYNRLSRVYRDDPQGQKNLDRRFERRNTRLYEKYADYGVEKEDLIRTE